MDGGDGNVSHRTQAIGASGQAVRVVLACWLLTGSAFAQSPSGSITGSIVNVDGTPAAGVPAGAMDLERAPEFLTGRTETEFPRVPPGSYRLVATPGEAYEATQVSVGATDVTDVVVTRSRQLVATGVVHVTPDVPLPRAVIEFVRPAGTARAGIDNNGRFEATLAEGAHRVSVSNLPQGFSIRSIKAGDVDLMREPFVLTAPPATDIVVELAFSGSTTTAGVAGRVVGLDAMLAAKTVVRLDGVNLVSQEVAIAPDGAFRFAKVLPGSYTLQLSSTSSPSPPPVRPLAVQVGNVDVTSLEVRVSTVDVSGVIEVADGMPVPMLTLMFNGGPGAIWHANNLEGTGTGLHLTLPPGDYQVSASPLLLTRGYTVTAVMAGDVDVLTAPLRVVEGRPVNLRVLTRTSTRFVEVSGRLSMRDPDEALPDALALYYGDALSNCRGSICTSQVDIGISSGPRALRAAVRADGSFSFPQVTPGSYKVEIYEAGKPERTIALVVGDADRRDVVVVVPALVTVTGRVVVNGDSPPIHPSVVLSAPGASGIPEGLVDQENRFRMSVPEGTYKLELDGLPPGYALTGVTVADTTASGSLVVMRGMSPVVIAVQGTTNAWRKVAGRVLDSLGAGNTSEESIELSDQEQRLWLQATIGPDGAFEFSKVLPGLYTVHLEGSGLYPRLRGLEEVTGRGPVVRVESKDVLDLRIERSAADAPDTVTIPGRVVADDGGPVPGLSFLQNGRGVSGTTYPDGRLQLSLEPGEQQISLSQVPDGFTLRSLRYGSVDLLRNRANIVRGRLESLEVVLSPRTPRALRPVRGRIVGQERLGLPAFVLALSSGERIHTTTAKADGSFELANVLPGTYGLFARMPGDTWWIGRSVYLGEVVVADSDVSGVTMVVPTPVTVVFRGGPGVDVARLEPYVVRAMSSGSSIGGSEETGALFVADGDRVMPGRLPPGYRMEALSFGDIDLLREPIRLGVQPVPEILATIGTTPPDPDVKTFSVSGRVTGAPGGGTSALRVRLSVPGEPALRSPVAADGSFRFDGISGGICEVQVVGSASRSRVVVSTSDVTGVVLAAR
jgi:hypothetical protein